MTVSLTLAHGSNARTDRDRLVKLSNEGTSWSGANGTIRGEAGPATSVGKLYDRLTSDMEATDAQLRRARFVIYSYATPIAWQTVDGEWVAPAVRYSPTTTRHQSYLYALNAR